MKKIGKYDFFLMGIVLFVAIVLVVLYFVFPKKAASRLVITVDGAVYGTYSLYESQEIVVASHGKETNTIVISDGQAYMKFAKCPDHLCMKQGKIAYDGQTIVCLPNRVVVQVEAEKEAEFDSVAK